MLVSLLNSYVEALTLSVAAVGNGAYKKVTKVEWGHQGGAWSDRTSECPYKKRHQTSLSLSAEHRVKAMWAHIQTAAAYKPGRELSCEANNDGTPISDF